MRLSKKLTADRLNPQVWHAKGGRQESLDMNKQPRPVWPRRAILAAALFVLSGASSLRAQVYDASEPSVDFGQLGQLNAGVTYVNPNTTGTSPSPMYPYSTTVGPNACVPTSVANGLIFLNNYYGENFFSSYNPSGNYKTVNDLANDMGTFQIQTSATTAYGGTFFGSSGTPPANRLCQSLPMK